MVQQESILGQQINVGLMQHAKAKAPKVTLSRYLDRQLEGHSTNTVGVWERHGGVTTALTEMVLAHVGFGKHFGSVKKYGEYVRVVVSGGISGGEIRPLSRGNVRLPSDHFLRLPSQRSYHQIV